MMRKIIAVFFSVFVVLYGQSYCPKFNCVKKVETTEDGTSSNLICHLPNKNATMPITALDVFKADGKTLKTYFGTGETVCDVLGWFNYEIPYMQSHYPKFSETIKKPLALTFFS